MKKSRILDGVNQARFVPPYILSLLLAVVFVQGGQQLAYLALEPISAVLSLILGFLGQGGFFEIFFNFALPFLLFGFVFMILALFLWVRWAEGRTFSTLGFVKKGSLVELVKGLAVGFLLFSLVALLWMIQGGAEELVTRAWLLPVSVKKTNLPIGLLTSSLLFALLHLGNPDIGILPIVNIALFGLFASLYLLRTDNVWGIIGLHAAWNFSQGNIYGFSVSGTGVDAAVLNFIPKSEWSWLTGGAFGAEASIFSSLILLLAVLYLILKMKKDGSLTGVVGKSQ